MAKHKHFKFVGFLNIWGEAEIHTTPKTWKVDFRSKGKVWENKHSKVTGFSNILGGTKIHTIPKTWEKKDFHSTGKSTGKHKKYQIYGFLKYFG